MSIFGLNILDASISLLSYFVLIAATVVVMSMGSRDSVHRDEELD